MSGGAPQKTDNRIETGRRRESSQHSDNFSREVEIRFSGSRVFNERVELKFWVTADRALIRNV